MKNLNELEFSGVGKAALCVATGYSFEKEIETIERYQRHVDIICCDKSLGSLIGRGIHPKYCLVCDANVSYEKYLQPWEDQLANTIMISNVCANPLWAEKGNWKDKYFFVVMDILKSELEFSGLSGCRNIVPAGTNVSNSLVIILTQSVNEVRKNFFGYDKILLIGFDYSWGLNDPYYAFDRTGGGKHNYMRHGFLFDLKGDLVCSSSNLVFSAKWLSQYITAFNLPVVQCTKHTVLGTPKNGKLSEQMQYSFHPEDAEHVRDKMKLRKVLSDRLQSVDKDLSDVAWKHHYSYVGSVS
jgi:hypothetical protein